MLRVSSLPLDVQAGLVVDPQGAVLGVVTAEMIAEQLRTPATAED